MMHPRGDCSQASRSPPTNIFKRGRQRSSWRRDEGMAIRPRTAVRHESDGRRTASVLGSARDTACLASPRDALVGWRLPAGGVESLARRSRITVTATADLLFDQIADAARRPYREFVDRLQADGRITDAERAALRRRLAEPLVLVEDPPAADAPDRES